MIIKRIVYIYIDISLGIVVRFSAECVTKTLKIETTYSTKYNKRSVLVHCIFVSTIHGTNFINNNN